MKKAARVINRYVDVVTLREDTSREALAHMGVDKPEIRVTADPALLLHPADDARVNGWFLQNGLNPMNDYVLFVLRPWDGFTEKAPVFAQVADWLYERHGVSPVFLALEPHRDLAASHLAAEQVHGPCPVLSVPNDGSLIVGIMGRMRAVVSMRLHALIFASAVGTPVVGAVYDPKVQAFLDYLGQKRYMPLEAVTEPRLRAAVEEALEDGESSAASIERLRALAAENEAIAQKLLEDANS